MSFHEKHVKVQSNKYIIEAKKYMEQNYYRRVSIYEVADMLHISDRYLYNLFVKYEHITPKEFMDSEKISATKKLLKNTDMSVLLDISDFCFKNNSLKIT